MVRRPSVASLDSGAESPEYGDESPMAGGGAPAAKPLWSGSGGRWLLWPMRIVLWAAILIIGYRGISAIVLNETPSSASSGNGAAATPAPSGPSFPVTLGSAYALQFGQVYLNFSPNNATERARELAAFIPANVRALQPQFGWNGAGTMQLDSEQVAGVDVRSAHTAVVTILATVNGSLIEIGVPLYASGHGIVVSGEPAWLPTPSVASPPNSPAASDPAAQSALSSQLPAFFQAYASGDQATLNRFLAPGASVGGLGGTVSFGSIASITVPRGGATRDITVTVNWVLYGQVSQTAPQLSATYDMSVIDQQSGKWYVREIRASTQPMGTQ
jgi:Conjugative transposon protein TcpC